MSPILFALFANISFATASLFFTDYSRKISASWMNYFKAVVAFVCFAGVSILFGLQTDLSTKSIFFLCLSGFVGLFIGDIFLLKAFTHLGSGRVLMLFGFQPLILGIASYYLFGQSFPMQRLLAVFLLMACLFTFSLESFKQKGHWDLKGLSYAILGVGLDAIGVILTKAAFEENPNLSPFYANTFRSGITVVGFVILSQIPWFKLSLLKPLKAFKAPERFNISLISFLGTFVALGFYLNAMKFGHLATVSAIAGSSPLFATLFETVTGKKKMTVYLATGTVFFIAGLCVLQL